MLVRKTLGHFGNSSQLAHIAKGLYSQSRKGISGFAAISERKKNSFQFLSQGICPGNKHGGLHIKLDYH